MGFWKDILKESRWVKENWKSSVGKGNKIRFWIIHWCGSSALGLSFTSLFDIVANKLASMADVWDHSVGNGSWNPAFEKAFSDWEIDLVANLLFGL